MNIVEFTESFRNLIIAGATIVTSWAAYTGVKTWKEELTGKTKFDIAKSNSILLINIRNKYLEGRQLSYNTNQFLSRLFKTDDIEKIYEVLMSVGNLDEIRMDLDHANDPLDTLISELNYLNPEAESMFGIDFTILCQKVNQEYKLMKNHYFIISHGSFMIGMMSNDYFKNFKDSVIFLLNSPKTIKSDDYLISAINEVLRFLKPHMN